MPYLGTASLQEAARFLAIAALCSHAQVAWGQLPALDLPDLLCRSESVIEVQHDNSDMPLLKKAVAGSYYFAAPESAVNYLSETEKKNWDLWVSNWFYGLTGKTEHWQYRAVMRRDFEVDGSEKRHWRACTFHTISEHISCSGDSTFNFYFRTGRFMETSLGTLITNHRTDSYPENSVVRFGTCVRAAPR